MPYIWHIQLLIQFMTLRWSSCHPQLEMRKLKHQVRSCLPEIIQLVSCRVEIWIPVWLTVGLPWWLGGRESGWQCRSLGDAASIPGLARSPGGEHDNPLQYSSLENPMDRGAWRITVHRVAKNRLWLKRLSMHACITDFKVHLPLTINSKAGSGIQSQVHAWWCFSRR